MLTWYDTKKRIPLTTWMSVSDIATHPEVAGLRTGGGKFSLLSAVRLVGRPAADSAAASVESSQAIDIRRGIAVLAVPRAAIALVPRGAATKRNGRAAEQIAGQLERKACRMEHAWHGPLPAFEPIARCSIAAARPKRLFQATAVPAIFGCSTRVGGRAALARGAACAPRPPKGD
jgi:hypothetical protein